MELVRYARLLRRRLWLLVACPLLAAVAAGAVSAALPPVYDARVSLLVRPAQPLAAADPNVVALTSDQISRTYATLMVERPLLDKVINDLELRMSSSDLAKRITVTPQPNTTILEVKVSDTNPQLARDIANRLVADFIAEVKQIQQQEATNPNGRSTDNLVVVSPAVTPTQPSSPNLLLNVAFALVAGLMVGLGFAFLLEYLDQSVKSDEDLTARTRLTVLGHIAYSAPGKGRYGELVSLVQDSTAAEGYKALRTNLLFSTVDRKVKTIVVTSPSPREGKSRTSANLAVALAAAGHPTLLVDADFRRPSQHRLFGRIRNEGLSNLIVGDLPEPALVGPVDRVPELWVLTSGPPPPNPSELLGSQRAREILALLSERFTYVVIDTPPINAVTDGLVLAAHADATLLVVEHGRTTYPALRRAAQSLDRVGAHTLGVVMNKLRASGEAYGYGYGYGEYSARGAGGNGKLEPTAERSPSGASSGP